MYHYVRDSNSELAEDNTSDDEPISESDREQPKELLKDKQLEDDSVDLFVNTSPPLTGAEMVELHHTSDPMLVPSSDSLFSPNHPLESID